MEPDGGVEGFRYGLYNAGGSLFNLIIGIALLVALIWIHNRFAWMLLFGLGSSGLCMAALNLIPCRKAALPNDGTNAREARKSAEAVRGFYLVLKTNADMAKGKRLTEFDDNFFSFSENADAGNYFIANIMTLRASQLEELGRYAESHEIFSRINPDQLPAFYGASVILALMFQELVFFGDEASIAHARGRVEAKTKDKFFQNLLKSKHPAYLPFQAAKAAFLDDDTGKAQELIEQAKALAPGLQNPGQEYSIMRMACCLENKWKLQ